MQKNKIVSSALTLAFGLLLFQAGNLPVFALPGIPAAVPSESAAPVDTEATPEQEPAQVIPEPVVAEPAVETEPVETAKPAAAVIDDARTSEQSFFKRSWFLYAGIGLIGLVVLVLIATVIHHFHEKKRIEQLSASVSADPAATAPATEATNEAPAPMGVTPPDEPATPAAPEPEEAPQAAPSAEPPAEEPKADTPELGHFKTSGESV